MSCAPDHYCMIRPQRLQPEPGNVARQPRLPQRISWLPSARRLHRLDATDIRRLFYDSGDRWPHDDYDEFGLYTFSASLDVVYGFVPEMAATSTPTFAAPIDTRCSYDATLNLVVCSDISLLASVVIRLKPENVPLEGDTRSTPVIDAMGTTRLPSGGQRPPRASSTAAS
jgi:hypothetical protein